ncbi:MAG TPA: hypothetical protein VIJ66_09975 [Solirubrobacteraceae bacterium]
MTSGTFVNPKVDASCDPVDLWYRYCAGYSAGFLRLLIAELRVNSKTDIQPTYRIVTPGVCATSHTHRDPRRPAQT